MYLLRVMKGQSVDSGLQQISFVEQDCNTELYCDVLFTTSILISRRSIAKDLAGLVVQPMTGDRSCLISINSTSSSNLSCIDEVWTIVTSHPDLIRRHSLVHIVSSSTESQSVLSLKQYMHENSPTQ